jgi:CRISPR-associated endonuclease/helicase Cas3
VTVRWPPQAAPARTWPELAAEISVEPDVLAIVHLRRDARTLCEEVDRAAGADNSVHLSALMCAQHRSEVLQEVRARKAALRAVRLIATQLVEAGVDIDFPVVYRALGGLDALAQAAGRCNREGRLARGELRVFLAPSDPPRGVLQSGLQVARTQLSANPELDLFALDTYRRYFEDLYFAQDLDDHQIQQTRASLKFRTTAEQFQLIDDAWSAPLVVPWGAAAEGVRDLERLGPSRGRLRALQRFLVNVPRAQVAQWSASGAVRDVEGTAVLAPQFAHAYHPRFGLLPELLQQQSAPEQLIVQG